MPATVKASVAAVIGGSCCQISSADGRRGFDSRYRWRSSP